MKLKFKYWIIMGIVLVIITLIAVFFITLERVDSSALKGGTVRFKYETKDGEIKDISDKLTSEEEETILNILNKKTLGRDNPSCGFDDDISIRFNNDEEIFSIACDNCGIIYWKNKDKYLSLTDSENETIRNILRKHGFIFPCV